MIQVVFADVGLHTTPQSGSISKSYDYTEDASQLNMMGRFDAYSRFHVVGLGLYFSCCMSLDFLSRLLIFELCMILSGMMADITSALAAEGITICSCAVSLI